VKAAVKIRILTKMCIYCSSRHYECMPNSTVTQQQYHSDSNVKDIFNLSFITDFV